MQPIKLPQTLSTQQDLLTHQSYLHEQHNQLALLHYHQQMQFYNHHQSQPYLQHFNQQQHFQNHISQTVDITESETAIDSVNFEQPSKKARRSLPAEDTFNTSNVVQLNLSDDGNNSCPDATDTNSKSSYQSSIYHLNNNNPVSPAELTAPTGKCSPISDVSSASSAVPVSPIVGCVGAYDAGYSVVQTVPVAVQNDQQQGYDLHAYDTRLWHNGYPATETSQLVSQSNSFLTLESSVKTEGDQLEKTETTVLTANNTPLAITPESDIYDFGAYGQPYPHMGMENYSYAVYN